MKRDEIIMKTISVLNSKNIASEGEFFFILASMFVYVSSPLKGEKWNIFGQKLLLDEIPLEIAIFMSDEQKNPDIFFSTTISKKQKYVYLQMIFDSIVISKQKLQKKFSQLFKPVDQNCVVLVPDIIDSYSNPTCFPYEYLKSQLEKGIFSNELTGHPFSWSIVDSVKNNNPIHKYQTNKKSVSQDIMMKYIQKELNNLSKIITCCIICRSKSTPFKSIHDYQTLYFCSIKCLNNWEL